MSLAINVNTAKPHVSTPISTEALQLIDDPAGYFGHSLSKFYHAPYAGTRALQLEGLKYRFAALRNRIPMLSKLCDAQGVDEITHVDDVVPLMFEHTIYKSYPPSFLENNRFDQINRWLSKLTTHQLGDIDVSKCKSIDEWLHVMDRESSLRICHSSGTSGTMSFLPIGDEENQKNGLLLRMRMLRSEGEVQASPDIICIQPYFRSGASGFLRAIDDIVRYALDGDESRLFVAYPTWLSADVLYLAARIRKARTDGTLDRLKLTPAVLARQTEFEQLQREMPQRLSSFINGILDNHCGKRVIMTGMWQTIHPLAVAGLKRGLESFFSPKSWIRVGGGAKGVEPPPGWQADVLRFSGVDRMEESYGMSEVRTTHDKCVHGQYHLSPTVIPYQLDPNTSKVLPRKGRVTGRAAFFDLCAEARWGASSPATKSASTGIRLVPADGPCRSSMEPSRVTARRTAAPTTRSVARLQRMRIRKRWIS
jgi:hypothetical protein